MDIAPCIDRSLLQRLARAQGPCATLWVPLAVADDHHNALQLRHAAAEASTGALDPRIQVALSGALEQVRTMDKGRGGLAMFVGSDTLQACYTDGSPGANPTVHVGERFLLGPFVAEARDASFVAVAVQLGGWRAFSVDDGTTTRLELPDAPESLEDAADVVVEPVPGGASHAQRTNQGPGSSTRVHPHGFGHEDRRAADAELYARELASALRQEVGAQRPVVLLGNEPWVGMFERVSGLHVVAREDMNPHGLSDEAVIQRARELLPRHPPVDALVEEVTSHLHGSDDPLQVAQMAAVGGVELLVVPEGQLDADAPLHEAVVDTLSHGGRVETVDDGVMPTLHAAFRWPVTQAPSLPLGA